MHSRAWQRLQSLFLEARAVSGAARERLLATSDADPGLIEQMRSLLAADETPGLLDELAPRLASVVDVLDDAAPERIGAYRLVRELGRGGMGVVYLAERVDGQFRHQAAIKLIGSTSATDPLHRRFLAERQILAGLQHPNIARLLDGGLTTRGRPYLVMEYVDGLPITTYCDRHRLTLDQRLRLFVDVCAAVQHAHQKLVIHRDLKPSNILVTTDGVVHLLDFGIAKLLDPASNPEATPATSLENRAMTPEYASPEQVRGDELTTASDVYALGVLLYELLCGSLPYTLAARSPLAVAEAVCAQEPVRPSIRVARVGSSASGSPPARPVTAEQRSTTVERLRRQLRGDLDSIVLMALRKEPELRYASADLLRQDVLRYFEGLPVLAHRGSRRYRVGKFMRRHRMQATAAVLVAASLVVGLGAVVRQSRLTDRERVRAELALAQSEEVTEFLMEMFRASDADPALPSTQVTALDLLQRGIARAGDLADQPIVQARLFDVIGRMLTDLGRYDDARNLLEQAVALRRSFPGQAAEELAASLIHLARVHRSRVDLERARPLVAEALAIRQRTLPPDHPEIADAYYELAWLAAGPTQEALYHEALNILQRTGAAPDRQVELLQQLSTNLRRQGRFADALAADRESLRLAEQAFGPQDAQTGYAMIHLGDHVRDLEDDLATAEQLYRQGLELMAARYGDHNVRLGHGLRSLAALHSRRGLHAEAEQLYRRSLAIRLAASGPDHPQVASEMQNVAAELARQGRLDEAETLARDALERTKRALGPRHRAVLNGRLPALARILDQQARYAEADQVYRDALEGNPSPAVMLGELRREYGRMLLRRGDFVRAEEQLLQALEQLGQAYPESDHPNLQDAKRALMELYRLWGRPDLVDRYRVPPGRFVPY